MKELLQPKSLKPGDTVAAISLSWGGGYLFRYRYEIAKRRLKNLFGLHLKATKHALKDPCWLYDNPEARANDLMDAFADPSIKAIFSIVGGDDSIRILPFIDYATIKDHPKIFLGHSDTTVSHFACLKAGLRSFYGPSLLTSFAENVAMHAYTREGIERTLFSSEIIGNIPPNNEGWTAEFLDWENPNNQKKKRRLHPPIPRKFINGDNIAQGRLIGGCIEVLGFINGTDIWPSPELWDNTILFLETSEEGISPLTLERMMRNLGAQGILNSINGLLFSKPGGHTVKYSSFGKYDDAIIKVLTEYGRNTIPVVTLMDFGHTDPLWTMPYGTLVEINPQEKRISILEGGVI